MNKLAFGTIVLLSLLVLRFQVSAQLTVTPGGNPTQLVNNVLLGANVVATNISYTGSNQALGTFSTGANPTGLGISSGLMMATGNLSTAIGPNNLGGAGTDLGLPGDLLLSSVCGFDTFDASVLEFDFYPEGDTISFRFVFGSEEYEEYVGTDKNDVFGFFVSGLDPITYLPFSDQNIAIIPNSSTPVSINTVNQNLNTQYYHANSGSYLQYDGFTYVLTAWCRVIPCSPIPYHIKLAIADGGDGVFDSGVFLEAGSFAANGFSPSVGFSNPGVSNVSAVEGCSNAILTLHMNSPRSDTVNVELYPPTGTAIMGTDFEPVSWTFTFLPNQTAASLTIQPILDSVTDGPKTIILLTPRSICMMDFDTIVITIEDRIPLYVNTTSDTTILCAQPINLSSTITGGAGPFNYLWNTGDIGNTIGIAPLLTEEYRLTVTDGCGFEAIDSTLVTVIGPVANAGTDTAICTGGTAILTGHGAANFLWNTGATTQSISVSPTTTTTYILTVSDFCSATDTVIVRVNPLPSIILHPSLDSICKGENTILSTTGGQQYLWTSIPPDPDLIAQNTLPSPTVSPDVNTIYRVTVTDTNGCSNQSQTIIVVKPTPDPSFTLTNHTICINNQIVINYTGNALAGSGFQWNFDGGQALGSGAGPYYLSWDTAGIFQVSLMVSQWGCNSVVEHDSVLVSPKPEVDFVADKISGCPPLKVNFTDMTLNALPGAEYTWWFGNGQQSFLQNPSSAYLRSGVYSVTLAVSNQSGCADTLKKTAYINTFPVPDAQMEIFPKRVSIFEPVVKFYDRSEGSPSAWSWELGDGSFSNLPDFIHTYADTGIYQIVLRIQNEYGCIDSAFNEVFVTPDHTIYVPNAFSPNGDGYNNIFKAFGTNIADFNMEIFSRWGEMVFSSDHIDKGWDGRYKGSICPTDVYTVIIKYRDAIGTRHSYYGRVSLLR